jgi:hypothetical protein
MDVPLTGCLMVAGTRSTPPPARINIAMDGAVHTPLPRRVNCVDYGLNGIGPQHLRSRLLSEPKQTAVEYHKRATHGVFHCTAK